jgi:hypothetical protein
MKYAAIGIVIAATTAAIFIVATNVSLIIQQTQIYGANPTSSLKDNLRANLGNRNQHLNQQGNCIRSDGCATSDVGQGTLGNDNSVTGFTDQSTTNATSPNASTSGPVAGNLGAQGFPGAKGDKGDPGAKGDKGDPGPAGTIAGVSKLVFATCTSNFNPITPGLGGFGGCSVAGAAVGDEVLMGSSRNDPGAGNLLVHLAYVDSPGHITFFVRSFGTNNFPATITWPIIIFKP